MSIRNHHDKRWVEALLREPPVEATALWTPRITPRRGYDIRTSQNIHFDLITNLTGVSWDLAVWVYFRDAKAALYLTTGQKEQLWTPLDVKERLVDPDEIFYYGIFLDSDRLAEALRYHVLRVWDACNHQFIAGF